MVIRFDASVTVATAGGTPAVKLRIGNGEPVSVPYLSGSGGDRLLFRHRLPEGQGSPGPFRLVEDSLHPLGLIHYAESGLVVPLRHPGVAAAPFAVSVAGPVIVDEDDDDSLSADDRVDVTLTFNEPVAVDTAGGHAGGGTVIC